jgi:hypothetical protein
MAGKPAVGEVFPVNIFSQICHIHFSFIKPLGTPRRRWEDNIKMDLQGVRGVGMNWIELAQDRDRCRALVNAVINLWVP